MNTGGNSGNTTNTEAIEEEPEGSGDELPGECPGIMLRNVYCEQITGDGLATIVEENLCTLEEKPPAQKACTDSEESDDDTAPKVQFTVDFFQDFCFEM